MAATSFGSASSRRGRSVRAWRSSTEDILKTMLVRPAEDRDIIFMASIRARRWESETFWQSRIGRYLTGEHSPQHALPERAAFVAVDGEAVVGLVAGHRTRRHQCDGELQWIDVVEECRGRGVAGTLLLTMTDWFIQQGALRVCVNVDPQNTVARGFYAKYGAVSLNAQWMVWEDARALQI